MVWLSKKNKGFSLLEVVLAIGLTGFVIVGVVGTITEYQRSILVKEERTQGYEYLQEATKALDTLKYDGLVGYGAGDFSFSSGNNWGLIPGGGEVIGDYQRTITLAILDSDTIQATINIVWIGNNGRGDNLSSQVTYKNWQEPVATCVGTQAQNITIDTSNWSFDTVDNKRIIRGIKLINNNPDDCTIQINKINPLSWSNNNLITVKIGIEGFDKNDTNFNVWTGINNFNNSDIDITDTLLTGTHELALEFDDQMSGQSLNFTLVFGDSSILSSSAISSGIDPCLANTQAQNSTLDISNWSFDSVGANQKRIIRGIRLINNTGTTCNISVNRINPLLWQSNNLEVIKIGDLNFDKNNISFNVWTGNLAPVISPSNNIDITDTAITNTKELALQYNTQMTGQNITFSILFSDGSVLTSGIISSASDPCVANTQAQNFQANVTNKAFPDTTASGLTSNTRIIRGIEIVNTTGTTCPVVITDINEFIWTTNVNLSSVKIGTKFINRTDSSFNVWTGNLTRDTSVGRNFDITDTPIENTEELLFEFNGTIFNSNNSFRIFFVDGSSYTVPVFNFSTSFVNCTNQANSTTIDTSQILSLNGRNIQDIRIRNMSGCRVRVTNINNITWTGNRRLRKVLINSSTAGNYNNTSPHSANITDVDIDSDYPLEFRFNNTLSSGTTLSFDIRFSDGTTKPVSLIIP